MVPTKLNKFTFTYQDMVYEFESIPQDLSPYQLLSEKDHSNGYPSLNESGVVPDGEISSNVTSKWSSGENLLTPKSGKKVDYSVLVNTPDLSIYQPINEPTLNTSSKTIPGSINELSGQKLNYNGNGSLLVGLTKSQVGLENVPNLSFSGSNTGDETLTSIKSKLGSSNSTTDGYLTYQDWNSFNNKQSALGFTPENSANKGVANGYAPLGSDSKIPTNYLPSFILGAMKYQGGWDFSTGIYPTSPVQGNYWVSLSTGTVGSITYKVGDWATYNGTSWDKIDNQQTVSSVFGRVGAIVATASDYTTDLVTEGGTNKYFTDSRARASISLSTTGNSGVSTYINGILNIPNYSLSGLGGQPLLSGTGFVKVNGTTVSYDNTNYLPLTGGTLSGPITASQFNGPGVGITGLTKSQIGLSNVDNTSDISKPISNATQIALNDKSPLNNPYFTGTIFGENTQFSGNAAYLGNVVYDKQVTINASQEGISPLHVGSSVVNERLNSDLLDGYHAADFALINSLGSNAYNSTSYLPSDLDSYWGTLIRATDNGSYSEFALLKPDSSPIFYVSKNTYNINFPGTVTASQFNGSGAGLTGTASSLTAANSNQLGGIDANKFVFGDDTNGTFRYVTVNINSISRAGFYTLYNAQNAPFSGDGGLLNIPSWVGGGLYKFQFAAPLNENRFYARTTDSNGDGNFVELYHTGNFTPSNYLSLAGGTMSNTNLVTNLNADLLRGYSPTVFHRHLGYMPSNQDFNTIGIGISENIGSSNVNSPSGAYGTLNTLSTESYYGWQTYMDYTGQLFNRSKQTIGWQPWRTIWDSGNFNPSTKANLTGGNFFSNIQSFDSTLYSYIAEGLRINSNDAYISGYNASGTARSGYLQFNTTDITLQAESNSKIILLNAAGGNVLIGTYVNSNGTLQIESGVNSYPATSGSNQTGCSLRLQGNGNGVLDFGTNSGNSSWIQSTDKSSLNLNYALLLNPNGGNVSVGNRLTIIPFESSATKINTTAGWLTLQDTTGTVGIGYNSDTNPGTISAKLLVNGNIYANGVGYFNGTVTATQFNGSGAGLTGTASSLSIGGNAATSTFSNLINVADDNIRNPNNFLPSANGQRVRFDFINSSYVGTSGTYAGCMTFSPYVGTTSSTGDASYQMMFGSTAGNGGGYPMLRVRKGIDSTWNSLYTIPLMEVANTGNLNIGGAVTIGGTLYFSQNGAYISNGNSGQGLALHCGIGGIYDFSLINPANNAYIMTVSTGTSNVNFGGNITTQGSISSTGLSVTTNGISTNYLYCTGSVLIDNVITASNFALGSDRRLKNNINPIQLVDTKIDYKEYELNSNPGEKRYGVIAQDLIKLGHTDLVAGNEENLYSVKYIDLFVKEIAYLKNELRIMKGKLN